MRKSLLIIVSLLLATGTIYPQSIINKLGGDTANETYEVTDSGDNLLFRVLGNKGALFTGTYGSGTIPVEGAGTRMMWYPGKSAFRVGTIDPSLTPNDATLWNYGNIGIYSIAFGLNTTASGAASFAMGAGTTASGGYSTAMGGRTTASGGYSTARGYKTTASGEHSTAMGAGTTASGHASSAIGVTTTASGATSFAMGQGIEASGTYTVAIALNDQNGTNVSDSNTMAIMGGKVGIGTISPDVTLSVVGTDAVQLPKGTTAEQPPTPTAGMIRFNTTTSTFEGYDGSTWVALH